MGVRGSTWDRRARNGAPLLAMLADLAARSFCNYLPGSQDPFSFFRRCFLLLLLLLLLPPPSLSIFAKFADCDFSP
jgi:hypothetical protein